MPVRIAQIAIRSSRISAVMPGQKKVMMPISPPTSNQPQLLCPRSPMAAMTEKMPSTSAKAPKSETSTITVIPGQIKAAMPKRIAMIPRMRSAHQWRPTGLAIISIVFSLLKSRDVGTILHALIKKVVERRCAGAVVSTFYTVKSHFRFLLLPVLQPVDEMVGENERERGVLRRIRPAIRNDNRVRLTDTCTKGQGEKWRM